MLILLVAYLGGVLTILSPCILPVLPFVFARADRPFRSHGLPLLLGMAAGLCRHRHAGGGRRRLGGGAQPVRAPRGGCAAGGVRCDAAVPVAGGPAEPAAGRAGASACRSAKSTMPRHGLRSSSPLLLGVGTGLLWAPCAGPILGLILTSAALNGASVGTSLLLLAYAAGACTSLAAALLFGGRVFSLMKGSLRTGEWVRRAAGVAVLAGVGAHRAGAGHRAAQPASRPAPPALEQTLVDKIIRAAIAGCQPTRAGDLAPGLMLTSQRRSRRSPRCAWAWKARFHAGRRDRMDQLAALTPQSLRGKVVLVDFWTYSCINCLRTLPYVRAWAEKYKDAGLVVVGVHTPEFAFEKLSSNVQKRHERPGHRLPGGGRQQLRDLARLRQPVVAGLLLHRRTGAHSPSPVRENRYDKAELVLQRLLAEAGQPMCLASWCRRKARARRRCGRTLPALGRNLPRL
jgi:thiol-disulfide isomerase/thioredoxin